MCVELHDERVRPGEFIVDRQHAEVVAGDPAEELLVETCADQAAAALAPVVIRLQVSEGDFLEGDLVPVGAGARGHALALVVGEHFPHGVGEQLGPRRRAAAAEQIERNEHEVAFQRAFLNSRGEILSPDKSDAGSGFPRPTVFQQKKLSYNEQQTKDAKWGPGCICALLGPGRARACNPARASCKRSRITTSRPTPSSPGTWSCTRASTSGSARLCAATWRRSRSARASTSRTAASSTP